ncbi:MAG TPA: HAD family hydrolase [Pseudobdellovibrionaceae bacterium]|nr:HAD family hydrolase [Pseudobdellovibrionaceae bacterium]
MSALQKAVFLDRDGTLIIDKVYLNDPEQIEYLPDVFEALRLLRDAGFIFLIATNQSGIARRLVEPVNLDETHRRMRAEFARHGVDLKAFYYAPYAVESNHWVRKPNPGMLLRGALDFRVDLEASWMLGDRYSDVEAGRRAGCRTGLLLGHESWPPSGTPSENLQWPDLACDGLLEMARQILAFERARAIVAN